MPDVTGKTQKFDASAQNDNPKAATTLVPKILVDEPVLSASAAMLMDQHTKGWKRDQHIAHPETGAAPTDDAAEVQAYYAYMATIDPSSATFAPPAFTLMPMPRGGLDTIVTSLLGRNAAAYDKARLKNLLFRLNGDALRTDNRYTLGQAVRVPTEMVAAKA